MLCCEFFHALAVFGVSLDWRGLFQNRFVMDCIVCLHKTVMEFLDVVTPAAFQRQQNGTSFCHDRIESPLDSNFFWFRV